MHYDYDARTVTVTTLFVPLNPFFWGSVHSRWPIVIRRRHLTGQYSLRYWDGDRNRAIGTLTFAENGAVGYSLSKSTGVPTSAAPERR